MTFNSIANKDKEPFHHCMERLFVCIDYYKNAINRGLTALKNFIQKSFDREFILLNFAE